MQQRQQRGRQPLRLNPQGQIILCKGDDRRPVPRLVDHGRDAVPGLRGLLLKDVHRFPDNRRTAVGQSPDMADRRGFRGERSGSGRQVETHGDVDPGRSVNLVVGNGAR